ncbi:MAG: NTP transferase domain-containing protein [Bacteroidota bacterium]
MMGPVTGWVLAGGGSRRMGRDKAQLAWADRTLLDWAIQRLRPICASVQILSSDSAHARPGIARVPDARADSGPLGGLVAGLRASPTAWNLFLAVDMPRVGGAALRRLLAEASGECTAVAYLVGEQPQPLVALYHRRAQVALEAALAAGQWRMQDRLHALKTKLIPLMQDHPDFSNVNRPEDYPAVPVRVLLFASFRERIGFSDREMVFPDTAALRNWLITVHPPAESMPYRIAVNQEIVAEDIALQAGDVVAVMPPFAGG